MAAILLIIIIISMVVYATIMLIQNSTGQEKERTKENTIIELKNKEQELKSQLGDIEHKLKNNSRNIKNIKNVISSICNSLVKKELTADEVYDLSNEYSKKINKFISENKLNDCLYNGYYPFIEFYKKINTLLENNNVNSSIKVKQSLRNIENTLSGVSGENYVRDSLSIYSDLVNLTSINLKYNYGKDKIKDNQIDSIIINNRGIFPLEIKNYSPSKMYYAKNKIVKIDDEGYIQFNWVKDGKKDSYTYNKGHNSVRKQMNLHRAALNKIFQKLDKIKYQGLIHPVCVITTKGVKAIGKDIVTIENLYSEVLNSPNYEVCLNNNEVKELITIIINENGKERTYPYTIMESLPDNVLDFILSDNYNYHKRLSSLISQKKELGLQKEDIKNRITKIQNSIETCENS